MNNNNWVSILNELPEFGQGVLIVFNNKVITIGYRVQKKNTYYWQIFGDLGFFDLNQNNFVTHWMLLPEVPNIKIKKEDEEKYLYPKHLWGK